MNCDIGINEMVLVRSNAHYERIVDIRKPLLDPNNVERWKFLVEDIYHSSGTKWIRYHDMIRLNADLSSYDREECWDSAGDYADRFFSAYEITFPISDNDERSISLCDRIMDLPEIAVACFNHRNDKCNWINGVLLSLQSNHYLSYDILDGVLSLEDFNFFTNAIKNHWNDIQLIGRLRTYLIPEYPPDYNYETITRRNLE